MTALDVDLRATAEDTPTPVLDVRHLSVEFDVPHADPLPIVRDVSFSIGAGEVVALVGESGSGKSVTSLSVLGLLGSNGHARGEIAFRGEDLLTQSSRELRRVRGDGISMVLQDAMTSLNPVHRVGRQIAEVLRLHRGLGRREANDAAVDLLTQVGIPDPERRAREYPHQLSGGMRQRVMIAMALACSPSLLIADEPTTALDVTVEAQVLSLIARLCRESQTAVLLVTHNLGIVADVADRVLVMYGGQIVESGSVHDVLTDPRHPYTRGLLLSQPDRAARRQRLRVIPGQVPPPSALGAGCAFASRCEHAVDSCRHVDPELVTVAPSPVDLLSSVSDRPPPSGHDVACPVAIPTWTAVLAQEEAAALTATPRPLLELSRRSVTSSVASATDPASSPTVEAPLLRVSNLSKAFTTRVFVGTGPRRRAIGAVRDVSFELAAGETLGLVGESGCGKSTTARLAARLLEPDGGSVVFDGHDITRASGETLRERRRDVQVVFQDSLGSLDPRYLVRDSIAEPLRAFGVGTRGDREDRVADLLRRVGLRPDHGSRAPHQLSGGQRQRVAIARALALNPKLVVCDEPVASLDVSIQAQVINLLQELQDELGLAYLFISHDLGVVHHVSDRIAVMYRGRIVELGTAEVVHSNPRHPYTKALLAAVPGSAARRSREGALPKGEPPTGGDEAVGCSFAARCPFAQERCRTESPDLRIQADGTEVACHFAEQLALV